jgi:phosphoesterase RecJ-like protein
MSQLESTIQNFLHKIREYRSLVIVSHEHPDADAHGSSLGLMFFLRSLGLEATYCNFSGATGKFKALPGSAEVRSDVCGLNPQPIIFADCASAERVGPMLSDLAHFGPVFNIDHHISNDGFGDYVLLDIAASSTSELVGKCVRAAGVSVTPEIGTNLLAGIYGDTGCFRYSNTSSETFEIASFLVRGGGDLALISNELMAAVPPDVFRFRNDILSRVQFYEGGKVGAVVVLQDDITKFGVDEEATEGIVEQVRDIGGVKVALILRETESCWRVSLRSRTETHNVSELAGEFGGGGHKCAAAFRKSGVSRQELEELLLPKVCQLVG